MFISYKKKTIFDMVRVEQINIELSEQILDKCKS